MSIKTQPDSCWRAALPNGEEYTPEYDSRHFGTRQEAADYGEGQPGVTARQFPKPCLVVDCDECGESLGDDDLYAVLHFTSENEARGDARDYDWIITADGRAFHDDCAPAEAIQEAREDADQ